MARAGYDVDRPDGKGLSEREYGNALQQGLSNDRSLPALCLIFLRRERIVTTQKSKAACVETSDSSVALAWPASSTSGDLRLSSPAYAMWSTYTDGADGEALGFFRRLLRDWPD